jgi:hypothetical protein
MTKGEEAVGAAAIQPKVPVPMHVRKGIGSLADV